MTISREQIVNRIRKEGFSFNDKGKHVEIYRQKGTGQRVGVPLRYALPIKLARIILSQAGLKAGQIDEFIAGAVK